MRLVVSAKREAGTQVFFEKWGGLTLDILDECTIDCFLESNAISRYCLLFSTLSEKSLGVGLLSLVVSGEGLVGDRGDINTCDVYLSAGSQSVDLIDAL